MRARTGAPSFTARPLALPFLLLLTVCVLLGSAGGAQAVGYRYWSFWERSGTPWTYATEGPSTSRPADGDVQGFRFAVSADSADAARPRGRADFAAICAGTPARGGQKRVALVLDFGTPADAPSGERPPAPRSVCARVPGDATTADALAAVAGPLRYDTNALLCAIAGYPAKGCGEQVASGQDHGRTGGKDDGDRADGPAHHGPSVGVCTGVAVVAVLGIAAAARARRRRG
ncbi:SCO2322 family protein [Streptomyces sp. NPDC052040]|uniref:SCO2322 family protein n=1 Tax=Streptomyces sp. NPDC052040 TaxID=3365682 RepID=UPI0037D91C5C